MALLDVRGLTVELLTAAGWVRPVNEVSLSLGAGESGSGKDRSPCKRKFSICWNVSQTHRVRARKLLDAYKKTKALGTSEGLRSIGLNGRN